MGGTLTKCISKKKRPRNSKLEYCVYPVNNNVVNNSKQSVCNSNLIDSTLSCSERNLLNEIRKVKIEIPVATPFTKFIRGKMVIRMASWNMKNLTVQKLKNPGVISVICLTILNNNISVIALQEVDDLEVANMICIELNRPTDTNSNVHEKNHDWTFINSTKPTGRMFQKSEYGLLIYDRSQNISILQNSQLNINTNSKKQSFTRNPFFVNIKINSVVFLIAVFHIKAKGFAENNNSRTNDEINDVALLAKVLKDTLKPGHKVIFMGDFNESPNSACFQALKDENYLFCIDGLLATNVSKSAMKCYDNFWINKSCEYYYTGLSGVITEGLSHHVIPKSDMMGWGGHVSDHCPVWVDFFVDN